MNFYWRGIIFSGALEGLGNLKDLKYLKVVIRPSFKVEVKLGDLSPNDSQKIERFHFTGVGHINDDRRDSAFFLSYFWNKKSKTVNNKVVVQAVLQKLSAINEVFEDNCFTIINHTKGGLIPKIQLPNLSIGWETSFFSKNHLHTS